MALAQAPRAAKLYGFMGLVPFIVSAAGAWTLPDPFQYFAAHAGLAYAAVILSFLGAVHWGHAMAEGTPAVGLSRLGLSVLPCLIAWIALLSHPVPALILLTASFAALYLADARSVREGRLPGWYRDLRRPLTAAALVCLGALLAFAYRANS